MIKKLNRVIIVTGLVGITMFGSPFIQDNPIMDFISNTTTITAMAAESYSDNWQIDSNGTWHYYMEDGKLCTSAWVHDKGEWYLIDANGNMLTGVVRSNGGKLYFLDTVPGTGTYGKMLTNGSTFNGVTISASTNADDEGCLTDETVAQLRAIGVNVDAVPNVENTKHVENGRVKNPNTPIEETSSTQPGGSGNGGGSTSSGSAGTGNTSQGTSTETSNPFGNAKPAGGDKVTGGGNTSSDIPMW